MLYVDMPTVLQESQCVEGDKQGIRAHNQLVIQYWVL
jgi:hypothetical protein